MKVGLVADPQYANQPASGKRHYRESLWKLEEAIGTFNYHKVDLIQNLGDVIDVKWESYDAILPIYDKLNPDIENYHLLGNHEFAVDSTHYKDILERLSMPDYYYSYSKKDGDLSYWTLQTMHTIQIRCMITISGRSIYISKKPKVNPTVAVGTVLLVKNNKTG